MAAVETNIKLKPAVMLFAGLFILVSCSQDTEEPLQTVNKSSGGIAAPHQVTSQFANMPDGEMLAYVSVAGGERQQMTISQDGSRASLIIDNLSSGEHELEITFEYQLANETNAIELANTTFPIFLKEGPNKPIINEIEYDLADDDDDDISNLDELVRGSDPPEQNRPPEIDVPVDISLTENNSEVVTLDSADPDGDELTFNLAGGHDQDLFALSSTGKLSFNTSPNYEDPSDSNTNNTYDVTVEVSDGYLQAQKTISITITNEIEMPQPPLLSINGAFKQLRFSWTESNEVTTTYNLMENPDGSSGFSTIANNLVALDYKHEVAALLMDWINARYIVEACNLAGCVNSSDAGIKNMSANIIGYMKASTTDKEDHFGYSVALSSDASTLAVGARIAVGIGGDEGHNGATDAGAVFVFVRSGAVWEHQAYVKASNSGGGDQFGYSVALSSDGYTLAVGAYAEDSSTTGVNNPPDVIDPNGQANNDAWNAGAVYVFTRNNTKWQQQAYIKASNTDASNTTEQNDLFGSSVALSDDGNTLAVGANFESGIATGVYNPLDVNDPNGQANNDAPHAGAVYVYTRSGITWQQQAYIKASNSGEKDEFGYSVALSEDGSTLAVGARWEASKTRTINGDEANNEAANAGAAYVFNRSGTTWQQQAYIKASNAAQGHWFGLALDLSADGKTLAVGAIAENSGGLSGSGAVYVFNHNGTEWVQQDFLKAFNANQDDQFGYSVELSGDASTLVVGARYENSNALGVDGDHTNIDTDNAGAAYLFKYDGTGWQRKSYIKASNTDAKDLFGFSVDLNNDGSSLVVGAYQEDSGATEFSGDQTDNNTLDSGAVYLY